MQTIRVNNVTIEEGRFFVIAGPCVVEDEATTMTVARFLAEAGRELDLPVIFKASYDKANRTSLGSYRGPGIQEGLRILGAVRKETGLPVLSDVHAPEEAERAADTLDILQIPAFLCRQTDLVLAAARTGRPINLKKGQFLAPWDMEPAVEKARSAGNQAVMLTERGTAFGYRNLVVDMRAIAVMRGFGCPVIFDATHSVQLPGGEGGRSGGQREFAEPLALAAVAAGADGVFLEIHPNPEAALCDGPNSLPLREVTPLLKRLRRIYDSIRS